jgi:4-hydroxybutyrate CoA-transferase
MHSGLVSDGALPLIELGVLTGGCKRIDRGLIVTNAVYGSRELYDSAGRANFKFRNVSYTHAIDVLAAIDNMVSINSAVEVDLWGQVSSETLNGRQISGIGGSVDFARGAVSSPGGRSIIALPSRTPSGRSRIVARLAASTPTTLARSDVGIIVTEHGIADLRGLTTAERARALINIADPSARADLERQVCT